MYSAVGCAGCLGKQQVCVGAKKSCHSPLAHPRNKPVRSSHPPAQVRYPYSVEYEYEYRLQTTVTTVANGTSKGTSTRNRMKSRYSYQVRVRR
eukprot:scaffold226178_cov24-Prasinocladus_malaysianus.AAC.1